MNKDSTRIIEINGVRFELDERTAKIQEINTFKVGDPVTLQKIEKSYEGKKTIKLFDGFILSFANFEAAPTVVVAYVDDYYSTTDLDIKKAFITEGANCEFGIIKTEGGTPPFTAAKARMKLIRKVEKLEQELHNAKSDLTDYDKFIDLYCSEVKKMNDEQIEREYAEQQSRKQQEADKLNEETGNDKF